MDPSMSERAKRYQQIWQSKNTSTEQNWTSPWLQTFAPEGPSMNSIHSRSNNIMGYNFDQGFPRPIGTWNSPKPLLSFNVPPPNMEQRWWPENQMGKPRKGKRAQRDRKQKLRNRSGDKRRKSKNEVEIIKFNHSPNNNYNGQPSGFAPPNDYHNVNGFDPHVDHVFTPPHDLYNPVGRPIEEDPLIHWKAVQQKPDPFRGSYNQPAYNPEVFSYMASDGRMSPNPLGRDPNEEYIGEPRMNNAIERRWMVDNPGRSVCFRRRVNGRMELTSRAIVDFQKMAF